MPFTPFHLGPALGIGLPLRKWIHVPTFMVASVILDVEPFLVLYLGLNYPLHGYLHTFLLASLVGLALGYASFGLEKFFQPLYVKLKLEPSRGFNSVKSFLLSGLLGTTLHVLLDAPLYADILPLFPASSNPLYNPSLSTSLGIYALCIWIGIFGIIYYAGLLIVSAVKRLSKRGV